MNTEHLIPIAQLSVYYEVDTTFLSALNEHGFIAIVTVEEVPFVHQDQLVYLEKAIRLHQELDVNMEALDVVFHLLHKVEALQDELMVARKRLRFYEG